jgi:hypothetical protein
MTMADFAASRTGLARAQDALQAAQAAAAAALQQQLGLAAALQQLDRQLDPRDPAAAAEQAALQAQLTTAGTQLAGARSALAAASQQALAAAEGFASFTDPRENIGLLGDGSPFALFPVRIETRFVTDELNEKRSARLLVRIYPDDCSIDTFEPMLSATELANAQSYWENLWRAGGIDGDERAAWGDLVAAHGSGRAGYIADTYQPVNLADAPVKAAASDEILVIPTQAPLAATEAAAVSAYWTAAWTGADDKAAVQAAATTLDNAVGTARAAQLLAGYVPFNLTDTTTPPVTRQDVAVSTTFVVFPADPPVKQSSWSQAPQIRQFPERFVVLGYVAGEMVLQAIGGLVTLPLDVGPDPTADPTTDPTSAIHPDGGNLYVPDQLRWMVDFETALAAGMALSIPLTPDQADGGFDRLLVIGVQMAASESDGAAALEELLYHHQVGRSGLSLIPQGTPTHNTTGTGSGYTTLDDANESFDDRQNEPLFTTTADVWSKRDGQWLAEALGVSTSLIATVHASGGQDQMQARAMQRALWPATLGYWMDKMMTPAFGGDVIDATRGFFTRYVSGRGPVPALRIGGQPYGVLPTTAFSRIGWLDERAEHDLAAIQTLEFLSRLRALATVAGQDWAAMSGQAAYVSGGGDPQQTLLDIVGLNPSSVEYYSRTAESLSELFNVQNLWGFGPAFFQAFEALGLDAAAAGLLTKLGYHGDQEPDILRHLFLTDADQLATIIDDRPLSESSPIRAYTSDGRNYLSWLIDAAQESLDAVVAEDGFSGGISPQALLYLLARHALMLGYYDTACGLNLTAGTLSQPEVAALKPEAPFVHVAETAPASESRFALLYATQPTITASPTMLVSDYITAGLKVLPEAAGLADQLAALAILTDAPTAQLERAFAEHVDLCSYRYDAWLLGLVNYQLEQMRAVQASKNSGGGVYLGTYAWLEDLRPSSARLEPAQVPPSLDTVYSGGATIMSDPANGGYVHAPSLPHARTAAILRSGYLANATSANPQSLAVNLSSDRVRTALATLEGIRNGQSLGALLGYQFENGLHDDYGLAEVDEFIYPLRKAFPLVADSLVPTVTPPGVPIEAIEARNVLDGRKLVEHIKSSGSTAYPFGIATLPSAAAAQAAAITSESNGLLDVYDAIADLALAEGVHQAAQGNFSRIAATLDAYTTGNFPPEPEVAQTPPSGIGLTQRVALHLVPGLSAPAGATPAAQAEPAIDAWLAGVLPPLATVGCTVTWKDPVSGTDHELPVSLADLGIRPIDVFDLVLPDDIQAMSQLDDRVLAFALSSAAPRPDAELAIQYLTAPPGGLSVFEVSALVRAVKTLVSRSRPLRATDAALGSDATAAANAAVSMDQARIAGPKAALDSLGSDISSFLATLAPLVADPVTQRPTILAQIDTYLGQAVQLLERAAAFRLPSAGWGFALGWRHDAFTSLMAQVAGLVNRWNGKLADYDTSIAAYDALPAATADDIRFGALQTAETMITTTLIPLPATPALFRSALDTTRAAFSTRLGQFVAVQQTTSTSFAATLAALTALLPVTDVDSVGFDVTPLGDLAVLLVQDLSASLTSQLGTITSRSAATAAQLALSGAATTAGAAVAALQAAATALLGEDFQTVPEFTLAPVQADEWANAVTASASGALLDYLIGTEGIDRPVDEWMYGVARVRPMVKAWETTTVLVEALRGTADVPALLPVQFPYQQAASWVAMQFDPADLPDSDRLCYTAHYAQPFDKTAPQCGLLLDEWTEVIPAASRTTGITFNFDRPDNEPPQAILLVTPASASGSWQWDDIVGALNETLDLAKVRAVEPSDLDQTPYSMLVPATITAATLYGISIVTSLSAANGVMRKLGSAHA